MEHIVMAIKRKRIPIAPAVVISNRSDAGGIRAAKRLGVPTEVIPSREFLGSRLDYDRKTIRTLEEHGVYPADGLVCLAGYMRVLSPEFVRMYKNRIMNIHPSLLPAFSGLDAQKQSMDYGVKYSGCTVHFVDAKVDTGPIIMQAVVKIKDTDTVDEISERILREEHRIYPEAVSLFAKNRIRIIGRRVIID